MLEKWLPVLKFETRYEVSNLGRVRTLTDNHGRLLAFPMILRGYVDRDGYKLFKLRHGKQEEGRKASVMVLESFRRPRPSPKHEASHVDGDPENDELENLLWETRAENEYRKEGHGTTNKGKKYGRHKLDEVVVQEIRRMRENGARLKVISKLFGLGISQCFQISKGFGKYWEVDGQDQQSLGQTPR